MRASAFALLPSTLLLAGTALALPGDVAPRGAPDGALTLGDAVLTLHLARDVEVPTETELRDADVFPGDFSDGVATPPVWTPSRNGELSDDDALTVLRAFLGSLSLTEARVLDFSSTGKFALAGQPYENTAFLDTPLTEPATYSLQEAPAGASIDPATGKVTYVPPAEAEGEVTLQVVADDGMAPVTGKITVQVQTPQVEGAATVTVAGGGEIEVTDPGSPIVGAKFTVPAGVAPDDEMLELSTVDQAPAWSDGVSPVSVPIVAPLGKQFVGDTSVTVSYDESSLPDGCTEDDLLVGFYQTGKFGDSPDEFRRPGWVALPVTRDAANDTITANLTGLLDSVVQVFAVPPPGACSVDNAGESVQFLIVDCPTYDLETARGYLETALAAFADMGMTVPGQLTVVVEELEDGLLGYAAPAAPTVLHLSSQLDEAKLQTTSAHEVFHLAQFLTLGPANMNVFSAESNLYVLESTAAWIEELVWDEANAYLAKGNRVFPQSPRFPVDTSQLRYAQFGLFNYLETSRGIDIAELFLGDRSDYANPGGGARAIDELLAELSAFDDPPVVDAFTDYVHAHGVRDPLRIEEIDTWGFPAPGVLFVPAEADAMHPRPLLPLTALPHLSGRSIAFDLDGSAPAEAIPVLRILGDAELRGALYLGGDASPLLELPGPGVVELPGFQGQRLELVLVNPNLTPGPVRAVEVDAFFACDIEVNVTEPLNGTDVTTDTVTVSGNVPEADVFAVTEVSLSAPAETVIAPVDGSGDFSVPVALVEGTNDILAEVMDPSGSCFGSDVVTVIRARDGAYLIVRLTWDLGNSDVDLYVRQPNGETIWFDDATSSMVLASLDRDDRDGFGPEVYQIREDLGGGGGLLTGTYTIRVHYFADLESPDGEPDRPASYTVDVIKFPGDATEDRQRFTGTILEADNEASGAGGTGPSWIGTDIEIVIP